MGEREARQVEFIKRRLARVSSYEREFTEFVEAIRSKFPRCAVFLFGSRATGKHKPSSDFDVIVVMEGQFDEAEMAAELLRLKPSGIPVDLIVLRRADLIRRDVRLLLRNSVLLYDGLGLSEPSSP